MLQYPVSTMMYSSVSPHEMCRLWHQARAGGGSRGPRARCSWCRDRPRRSLRGRRDPERGEAFQMRTLNHTTREESIQCVERHLCADAPYCPDSESVSEISIESETRKPSVKNNKKKVTYQTKAEVNAP